MPKFRVKGTVALEYMIEAEDGDMAVADAECFICSRMIEEEHGCKEVSINNDWEAERIRACRVCGCTDNDCTQCVERTGHPCRWVEEDLCSACVGREEDG